MSPNLAAGSAAEVNPPWEEKPVMEPAMAGAILQSRAETKTESGSVERTYTQIAHMWPLEDDVKFDNVEVATQAR